MRLSLALAFIGAAATLATAQNPDAIQAATATIQGSGPASTMVLSTWSIDNVTVVAGDTSERVSLVEKVIKANDASLPGDATVTTSSPAGLPTAAADPLVFEGSIMGLVIFCALSIYLL